MSCIVYDYAIIGAGAAGLHLALAMQEDTFFSNKKILIIEKEDKNTNDRTWCFWETGEGKWDDILRHTWSEGSMFTPQKEVPLDMGKYSYKMLRGLDFYSYAQKRINVAQNITWQKDEVTEVKKGARAKIIGTQDTYEAFQVFDSRIPQDFFKAEDKYSRILQHFKGWFIETETDVFDPEKFTMMDFRKTYNNTTSFTYVLPFSKRTALVEFTFFTADLEEKSVYDNMLRKYIEEIIAPGKYRVTEEEEGVIPMTDYPFHKNNDHQVTKIGTAGSWVKPSSGYSFKNAERYSQQLISNIKANKMPAAGIPNKKFRFYDSLFLVILENRNYLGVDLFSTMYKKKPVWKIFRFLDEKTNFREDLRIMSIFDPLPFIKAMGEVFRR